jgi:hypothetical protein
LERVIDETKTHDLNPNATLAKAAVSRASDHKRQREAEEEAHAAVEQERNLSVLGVLRLLGAPRGSDIAVRGLFKGLLGALRGS